LKKKKDNSKINEKVSYKQGFRILVVNDDVDITPQLRPNINLTVTS